jgi:hypothetical protein
VESIKKTINEDVQVLNIDGKPTNNLQAIVSAFNEYFLSFVEKIYLNNNNNNNDNNINNNPIYCNVLGFYSRWNFTALKNSIHNT